MRCSHKICGARLSPVLGTLEHLKHETKVWFEITTLLIPEENDSAGEIDSMTRWVVERLGPYIPMHFSAFHPDWKMLDHPPTPRSTLLRARDRDEERRTLRLCRQCPRQNWGLSSLRSSADRTGLVRSFGMEPVSRRGLRSLRHALRRRVRQPAGRLEGLSPTRAPWRPRSDLTARSATRRARRD